VEKMLLIAQCSD
jgi:hypothetical protein